MKKRIMKTAAALLSAVLAAGALTGCGKSTQNAGSEGTGQVTQSVQAADGQELTVVKILGRNYTYTGANGKTMTLKDWYEDGKSKRWQKLTEDLAQKGVALELELIEPDQFDTTCQTMAASGEFKNYDLINITPLDTKTRINLVKQGQLQPVSDIWEQYSEGPAKEFFESDAGQFYANILRLDDGKVYWLTDFGTSTYEGTETGSFLGFSLRQDWLDKAGLQMPSTTDELYDTLVAFQTQDVNGSGTADEAFYVGFDSFATDIAQWFGLGIDVTFVNSVNGNKVESPWYQENVKEYITYMQKLYQAGVLKMNDNQTATDMAENKVSAISNWAGETWLEPTVVVPEGEAYPWYVPVKVQAIEGEAPLFRGQNGWNPGWTGTAVSGSSDKQEASAKIFDWLVSDEAVNLTEYGIEDISYNVVDGKKAAIKDSTLENVDAVGMALWTNGSIFPRFELNMDVSDSFDSVLQFAQDNGVTNNPGGKIDYLVECAEDVEHRLFHDKNMLATATLDEISRSNALTSDLNTYSSELLTKLIMGEQSLDNWDSYIKDLKELGLDELIAIDQARCDRTFAK